jgi:hypothetical protein
MKLDITALYFFGAYGLGMLAFWVIGWTVQRKSDVGGRDDTDHATGAWVDFANRPLALCVASALMLWVSLAASIVRWQARNLPSAVDGAGDLAFNVDEPGDYSIFSDSLSGVPSVQRGVRAHVLQNGCCLCTGNVAAFGTSVRWEPCCISRLNCRAARKSAATVPTPAGALA